MSRIIRRAHLYLAAAFGERLDSPPGLLLRKPQRRTGKPKRTREEVREAIRKRDR
jgi:hypothetical protein